MIKFKTHEEALNKYREIMDRSLVDGGQDLWSRRMAAMGRSDLYFLNIFILSGRRQDFLRGSWRRREFIFQRCKMVQNDPNGFLDLWARFHYKSSIISISLTIQDILNDPEVTIGLFSFSLKEAKKIYNVIKQEIETNEVLKVLYPDVLFMDPKKESPKWTEDEGLIVRRKGNPRETTLAAFGLIDNQPTGSHFQVKVYDDVITEQHVTNAEMLEKVAERLRLSFNLTSHNPVGHYGIGNIKRFVGTKYDFNDTYKMIEDNGVATVRKIPATDNGSRDGEPVLLTKEELEGHISDMGTYIAACQLFLNPTAGDVQGFKSEWLCYYPLERRGRWWSGMNVYLLCDPAGEKKVSADFTVILVIGLAPDLNYYLIDGIRDRLNLSERTKKVIEFRQKYMPVGVGYEKYGKDSDIEHIKDVQGRTNRNFRITPLGGSTHKHDRMRKLIPLFEASRFWLPPYLYFMDHENRQRDLIADFKNEYFAFPRSLLYDDILDCMSRIVHEQDKPEKWKCVFPDAIEGFQPEVQVVNDGYDVLNYMTAA